MIDFSKLTKWFKNVFKIEYSPGARVKKLLWGLLFFVIISLILTINLIPNRIDLKVGQVSNTDIAAPRTVTFIDQEKTEKLQDMAAESAPKVYEEDKNVNNNIKREINKIFEVIKNYRQRDQKPTSVLIEKIKSENNLNLSQENIRILLEASENDLQLIEKNTMEILDDQLQQHILPGDLETVKDKMEERVSRLQFRGKYTQVMNEILQKNIRPNMILNEEATSKRKQEARSKVKPVKITVRQGEIIVRKGDVVTEDDIKILEVLGLQKRRINYLNIFGVILLVIFLLIIISFYFYQYKPDFWEDNKKLVLLEILVIIILLLAKIISIFQSSYLSYLVPVAAVSILLTVLLSTDIAVISTIFLSIIVALLFNNPFNIMLVSFISGLIGIFSVSRLSQRSDLVRAGFYVSAVLSILIFGINILRPVSDWVNVLKMVGTGVLNGVFVAILANGLLPYLENAFGMTSSVKLLELSNPSQPLLKRLLVEAPGTYHHSVIVGNLAETAADNIGANSLLARVGAYYHDIGKLKRPYFFTDNQFGGENPHDKISANLSALIIKSHVKDGVELAKEKKLPEDIIKIIKQHHGTNLISFFYQQAREDSKHDTVEESDFRYDGPKPRSREAAIIMLADIVEAAVRSKNFNKNDHNRIEVVVRDLIREKLIENQLDESELTLKELDVIADSFVKVLTGIYHHRVEYPENILKEMKRDDKDDKSGNK